ncbi:MAG TPA: hypothetical protein VFJ98_03260 [Mycobacteriales bacterium]|nr:hypothetical protein [Mycobacteriales bacterium]
MNAPSEPLTLDQLIDDCRQLPAAMLPHPRTEERRVIDLTAPPAIPDSAASLVDGYDPVY